MEAQTLNLNRVLEAAFAEGCTQSEMTTLDNCGMLWWWRYGLMLKKKGMFSWALVFGSGFHTALEEMYATAGERWSAPDLRKYIPAGMSLSQAQQHDLEYWQGVLKIQTECYRDYWKDDFKVWKTEKVELIIDLIADLGFGPIRLKGMIDLSFMNILNKGMWMLDHKTTGRLNLATVQGWDFRFQFMFYLWLYNEYQKQQGSEQRFRGYYINAIKKPTIRVRKGDTLEVFFERLRNEMMMEPEKYYYREQLLLNQGSLDYFEKNVLTPKLHRIFLLTNPTISDSIKSSIVHNMNTDNCQRYGVCEFLPLCQHGQEIEGFQYETRAVKHTELEGEED